AQAQATGKVMVVDDSSVARHQIEHALEQIGVSCDIYEDGNQALRALERQRDAGTTLYDEYL
ncbi:MAG: hypothetical protein GWN58_28380, partial [Anaerolineae bacterium]|nr:hypothetical protein [Anaerolineae bacterium]